MPGTVLVTDGDERSALAVVRSLGRAGWRVVVVASRMRSLAGSSRYASGAAVAPDPLADPDGFATAVAGVARDTGASFVLPMGEAALLAILARRQDFAPGAVPWPSLESVRAICDKATVLERGAPLGIRVPAQVVVHDRDDLAAIGALAGPVVVKPARSVSGAGGAQRKFVVVHAPTSAAAVHAVRALPEPAFPVLVQERVVGPGIGIFVLRWEGQVRAVFAHRRLREKPPSGGVSVYREAITPDPALLEQSIRLLEAFDWQGVAMIEYKVDAASGTPVLMEINGRFWGSLQLAIDAGVDFPVLLLQCAQGHPPGHPPAFDTRVRLRWWWGEVDHLLARLRRSDAALGLPPGSPSRWQAVLDFLRRHPDDRGETWRRDDPAPFRRETLTWLGAA